jgi:hypothetical protein
LACLTWGSERGGAQGSTRMDELSAFGGRVGLRHAAVLPSQHPASKGLFQQLQAGPLPAAKKTIETGSEECAMSTWFCTNRLNPNNVTPCPLSGLLQADGEMTRRENAVAA